jgi:hypothetical protein
MAAMPNQFHPTRLRLTNNSEDIILFPPSCCIEILQSVFVDRGDLPHNLSISRHLKCLILNYLCRMENNARSIMPIRNPLRERQQLFYIAF